MKREITRLRSKCNKAEKCWQINGYQTIGAIEGLFIPCESVMFLFTIVRSSIARESQVVVLNHLAARLAHSRYRKPKIMPSEKQLLLKILETIKMVTLTLYKAQIRKW